MIFWCVNIFSVTKYCTADEKLKYLNSKISSKKIDIFKGIKCIYNIDKHLCYYEFGQLDWSSYHDVHTSDYCKCIKCT